jgi:hypothetical protein
VEGSYSSYQHPSVRSCLRRISDGDLQVCYWVEQVIVVHLFILFSTR